jgi:hypothetical protein
MGLSSEKIKFHKSNSANQSAKKLKNLIFYGTIMQEFPKLISKRTPGNSFRGSKSFNLGEDYFFLPPLPFAFAVTSVNSVLIAFAFSTAGLIFPESVKMSSLLARPAVTSVLTVSTTAIS